MTPSHAVPSNVSIASGGGTSGRSASAGTRQCAKSRSCHVIAIAQGRDGTGQGRCAAVASTGCTQSGYRHAGCPSGHRLYIAACEGHVMNARWIAGAVVVVLAAVAGRPAPAALRAGDATRESPLEALGGPAFLENGGRLPDHVGFTVDGHDRTLFFGADA